MNTIVTSREAILEKCRQIVTEQGISAINMRTVASSCGIAVGSLYHYFPSKTDLISAAVEDIWRDIFHMPGDPPAFETFTDCLTWLFADIREGCARYPGFFTLHALGFTTDDRKEGRRLMERYFCHMKESLCNVLDRDPAIRPDAFNKELTREAFVEFIFTSFISMLLQGQTDCGPLSEIAGRCLY